MLSGWAIDLKALYGRKWRDKEKWERRESLWESPDGETAAVLYAIAEIGVAKEIGRLAVFHGKGHPELVFNPSDFGIWHLPQSAVQFGADGVFFVHRFTSGRRMLGVKICAVDATKSSFAALPLADDFYFVRPLDDGRCACRRMAAETEETIMDARTLSWKRLR